jgi:hypothetical protein
MTTGNAVMTFTSHINYINTFDNTQSSSDKYQDVIRLLEAIHGDNHVCFQTFDDAKYRSPQKRVGI